MKKILIASLAIASLCMSSAIAQPGLSNGGKKVEFTFPVGVTANKTYLFPTFDIQSKDFADTVEVTINQLNTYVTIGDLTDTCVLDISLSEYILPGATIYLKTNKSGSNRVLRVYNADELVAENITISAATTLEYIYTGTAIVRTTNLMGATGATGATGAIGATGATGATGPTGP